MNYIEHWRRLAKAIMPRGVEAMPTFQRIKVGMDLTGRIGLLYHYMTPVVDCQPNNIMRLRALRDYVRSNTTHSQHQFPTRTEMEWWAVLVYWAMCTKQFHQLEVNKELATTIADAEFVLFSKEALSRPIDAERDDPIFKPYLRGMGFDIVEYDHPFGTMEWPFSKLHMHKSNCQECPGYDERSSPNKKPREMKADPIMDTDSLHRRAYGGADMLTTILIEKDVLIQQLQKQLMEQTARGDKYAKLLRTFGITHQETPAGDRVVRNEDAGEKITMLPAFQPGRGAVGETKLVLSGLLGVKISTATCNTTADGKFKRIAIALGGVKEPVGNTTIIALQKLGDRDQMLAAIQKALDANAPLAARHAKVSFFSPRRWSLTVTIDNIKGE